VGVALHHGNFAKLAFDADAVLQLVVDQSQRTLDAFVQIHGLYLGFIQTGEVAQAANDTDNAVAGQLVDARDLLHDAEHSFQVGVAPERLRAALATDQILQPRERPDQDVAVAGDRADRRVHVVGDAGYQRAQSRHFFLLYELRVGFLERLGPLLDKSLEILRMLSQLFGAALDLLFELVGVLRDGAIRGEQAGMDPLALLADQLGFELQAAIARRGRRPGR